MKKKRINCKKIRLFRKKVVICTRFWTLCLKVPLGKDARLKSLAIPEILCNLHPISEMSLKMMIKERCSSG